MVSNKYPQIITSILDNDLYALTQSQAALFLYPDIVTEDKLLRAGEIEFPEGFAEELRAQVDLMENIKLSDEQAAFLRRKCYYLKPQYIEWLKSYRFDPHEIEISQIGKTVEVNVKGKFCCTEFWETPIMAIISELYFKMTGKEPDHNYIARAEEKGRSLRQMGARFSEFGTRRRFSKEVQRNVLEALIDTAGLSSEGGVLNGTSNVQLAMDFDIAPMGTNAHKWYQFFAGIYGVRVANKMALEAWQEIYDTRLGIALTDTFTTDEFLKCFNRHQAMLYDGVRQDSGDPIKYVDKIVAHYKKLDIDPMSKTILFSDSLNLEKVREILIYCKGKIKCAFGIGTYLSNDISGVEPLRIVIKQIAVYLPDGRKVWTVKISDDPGKSSGDLTAQIHAKYEIGIVNTVLAADEKTFEVLRYLAGNATLSLELDGKTYQINVSNILVDK